MSIGRRQKGDMVVPFSSRRCCIVLLLDMSVQRGKLSTSWNVILPIQIPCVVHLSQPERPEWCWIFFTIALAGASQTTHLSVTAMVFSLNSMPFVRMSSNSDTISSRNIKSCGFDGPRVRVTGKMVAGSRWMAHRTGQSVELLLLKSGKPSVLNESSSAVSWTVTHSGYFVSRFWISSQMLNCMYCILDTVLISTDLEVRRSVWPVFGRSGWPWRLNSERRSSREFRWMLCFTAHTCRNCWIVSDWLNSSSNQIWY